MFYFFSGHYYLLQSQYMFLYDAMLEYNSRGYTTIPISSLSAHVGNSFDVMSIPPGIEDEFQVDYICRKYPLIYT